MLTAYWIVEPAEVASSQPLPAVRLRPSQDPLGAGILRPLHRTERGDFLNGSGAEEVLSCVGQVLGTVRGTLPWRPDFGSDLNRLRHQHNDPTLAEVARVYVDEALRKWEPRAELVSVEIDGAETVGNTLALRVAVRIGSAGRVQTLRVSA